jgi:hypothetical protein
MKTKFIYYNGKQRLVESLPRHAPSMKLHAVLRARSLHLTSIISLNLTIPFIL